MAELEIQGKSIEMETYTHGTKDFVAKIAFNTPESVDSDKCRVLYDIHLGNGKRSEFTFDRVESEINEYLNENWEDIEIEEFLSIEIYEKKKIKRRPYGNYEY